MPLRTLVFFLLGSIATANADTIQLSPAADTCLFEFLPNHNWGADTELVAGVLSTPAAGEDRCRILMKFDIDSAIPPGSTITAASLTMSALRAPSSPQNGNFQLLRLFVPWNEGSKDGSAGRPGGATATTGETTWNHRLHTGTTWESPGGKLEFDFAEDPSASVLVSGQPNPGPDNFVLNFNSDGIADLNSMLNSPAGNHGWVFMAQNENLLKSARRWASREHATSAPILDVTFTPPPAPLEITSATLDQATGNITIIFNSLPGQSYEVQSKPSLDQPNWDTIEDDLVATSSSTAYVFAPPTGAKRLFFRVALVEL